MPDLSGSFIHKIQPNSWVALKLKTVSGPTLGQCKFGTTPSTAKQLNSDIYQWFEIGL